MSLYGISEAHLKRRSEVRCYDDLQQIFTHYSVDSVTPIVLAIAGLLVSAVEVTTRRKTYNTMKYHPDAAFVKLEKLHLSMFV